MTKMYDDRISNKSLDEFVKAACMSEFEGCLCTRPKNHSGLHKCGSALNKCSDWTDEQADEWWQEFQKDL